MSKTEINKQRTEELQKIIKPIEEFMNKYCCPHDMLVIQQGFVQLLSGEVGIPLEIPD